MSAAILNMARELSAEIVRTDPEIISAQVDLTVPFNRTDVQLWCASDADVEQAIAIQFDAGRVAVARIILKQDCATGPAICAAMGDQGRIASTARNKSSASGRRVWERASIVNDRRTLR